MLKVDTFDLVNTDELAKRMEEVSDEGELDFISVEKIFLATNGEMRRKASELGLEYEDVSARVMRIGDVEYFRTEVRGLMDGQLFIKTKPGKLTEIAIEQLKIFAEEVLAEISSY